jgi:hypothetical protein
MRIKVGLLLSTQPAGPLRPNAMKFVNLMDNARRSN